MDVLGELIQREGGYADNPDDDGGPTKYGITLGTLREWHSDETLTKEDVRNLSVGEAREIYHRRYLTDTGICLVSHPGVREVLLDAAVNHGPARAIRYMQDVVGVVVDGILGPLTVAAINRHRGPDLVIGFSVYRTRKIAGYVQDVPSELWALKGWINRSTQFILEVVDELSPTS